jgi:hypothetical protein
VSALAGSVVWGIVPFAPEPPFRIYAGEGRAPFAVESPQKLIDAARKGSDSEFPFIVPGKARPVLILSDRRDERLNELIALRLLRLSKLDEGEQALVRDHRDPALFHLEPASFPDLKEENAAMVTGLVRVHENAIDVRERLGRLDTDELRVVHERVARQYGLDLHRLVMGEIQRIGEAQRRRT